MSSTQVNTLEHKILSAIQRKGKASLTDIKRSIAEFNQAGGADKLRKHLADLVSNGSLTVQAEKSGNGQTIESYCLINGNDCNVRNVQNNIRSGSNRNPGNAGNLKISGTFDIALEGWENVFTLLFSLLIADTGTGSNDNNNESNAEPLDADSNAADAKEPATAVIDDEDDGDEIDCSFLDDLPPLPKPTVPVRQESRFPARPSSPPRPVRCPVDTEYERVRRLGLEDVQTDESSDNSSVDDFPF